MLVDDLLFEAWAKEHPEEAKILFEEHHKMQLQHMKKMLDATKKMRNEMQEKRERMKEGAKNERY